MMLRTPPVRQKRSSPSTSPFNQVKQGRQLATGVESRSSPSPSKRLRRPVDGNIDDADEPFSLRSLHKGSPWGIAQQSLDHGDQHVEELSINARHAARKSLISDPDSEPELDWDSLRCSYKCRNLVKSDVLISLDSREKEVVELRATVEKLRAAYAISDEERRKLKKRVYGLEQGLAAAKERETCLYRQRTQESERNGELLRTQMARCAELEALLQAEMKNYADVQARALALESRVAVVEDENENNLQSAVRETNRLNQELERLETDSVFSIARVNAELKMEKSQSEGAAAEAERLSTQLNEMQGNMAESLAERLKLEHQIFDVDVQTSSTRTTGTSEAELVIKHLKEELSQCEAEIRDARKLKVKHVNAELLKERLASEKARADRAEAELSNIADLESKVKELETELSSWKETISTLPGVENCNDVKLKFAELQREVVAAVAKTGESNAQVVKLQTALELAETSKHHADTAADAAQAEAVEAVLDLKRAERKVSLLAKERDGLKAILASYDEEEHVIASHQKSVTGIANLATPEKAKEFRIQQLERALADSQQQVKLLGEEVEKSMKSTTDQRHRAESLTLMLAEAQEKCKAVDREAGQLRSELAILEAKVGNGESDSSKTKVLHMIINPEAEVHGQSEAEALRVRLEMHEKHFNGCRDQSPVNDIGVDREKVTALTQRVTALEKREARYKQVFANKISVFREACGLIFGYKVQMNEELDSSTGSSITLFTLRSIYSTSEEEQIQFQFKAATLEMIANDYVSSPELQRQVNTFMRNYKSIPAFIANLTMEQFNKTTLGLSLQMTVGSKDHQGSFKIRSRTPDTIEGPISEAYIQHWFQEEFLRLFHEDPEFHEQVLKCLLTGEDDEGNAEVRKPRRTWVNGIDETQEISCEEARYLHLCGENTTASDLSSEAAEEKCDVALRTTFAIHQKPRKQHLSEMQMAGSLEPSEDSLCPSNMFGTSDTNQCGALIGGCLTGGSESHEDMVESPFPPAVASEGQHKNLESCTGPCVHERGTQTWKANPLYLLGNSDSDSNDSWQQEGPNVAWMDDLENGKMLHEVKMRKVKRLEQSLPSRKAEGNDSSIEHSKSDQEQYFLRNVQGLPQFFTQNSTATHLQGKKIMHDDIRGNLSIRIPCRATMSVVCARPEQSYDKAVTSSPEKNTGEILGFSEDNSTNFPFVSACRDTGTSPVCVHGDETGDITSARASAEERSIDQDPVMKPPPNLASQDLPVVFANDDERALSKEPLPKIFLLKSNQLGCEAGFSSGTVSDTQAFDMNENEKPKTSSEFLSPAETPAETRPKLEDEQISPIPSISSSALLGAIDPNEEDAQSLAVTCPEQQENFDAQLVFLTDKISLLPGSCALDDQQGEVKPPSESVWRSEQSLKEELSISQERKPSLNSILSSEDEQEAAQKLSPNESNKRVEQEIRPFGIDVQSSFDEQGPSLVTPPQASPYCGVITSSETTKSVNICGDMFGEKKVKKPSSPLSLRTFRASRLEAIDEEEQVVHPPEPLSEGFPKPIAARAPFKPSKDIHWLPPKRNIHFMGIQTKSPYYPLENYNNRNIHFVEIHTKSPHYSLENFNRANINWDVPCIRPQAQAHKLAHEEALSREDKVKKGPSRSQQNRIQLWVSLLSKLFKRTIMIRWVANHQKSDQDMSS